MMVSSRIATLTRSGIRRVMQLSAQAEASGRKVVHLEVGQPDFPTPTHIQDAANLAVRAGKTGYTVNAGIPELRDAVAQRIRERTGRAISRKHVCVTSGAVNAIFLALSAYLEPGEEVLVPDPGWPNYHSAVAMAGAVSVRYPLSAAMGYEPDFEALERFVSPRTRVLFIIHRAIRLVWLGHAQHWLRSRCLRSGTICLSSRMKSTKTSCLPAIM